MTVAFRPVADSGERLLSRILMSDAHVAMRAYTADAVTEGGSRNHRKFRHVNFNSTTIASLETL